LPEDAQAGIGAARALVEQFPVLPAQELAERGLQVMRPRLRSKSSGHEVTGTVGRQEERGIAPRHPGQRRAASSAQRT